MPEKGAYIVGQIVMVVVSLAAAFLIAVVVPGDPKTKLVLTIGYALLALTFLFAMTILVEIIRGNIDLSSILSEDGKGASMSRFQLLIFTFVIALGFFLLTVENGKEFPRVPADVLVLLGISASTYAVSKGIQAGSQSAQNGGGAGSSANDGGNTNGAKK